MTWWLGDMVGILTVAPLLLVVCYESRQRQDLKYLIFPLVSGATGLAFITGYNVWKLGDHAAAAYLGVSPAWWSLGLFCDRAVIGDATGILYQYYLGIEQYCAGVRSVPPTAPRSGDDLPHRSDRTPGRPRSALSADQ